MIFHQGRKQIKARVAEHMRIKQDQFTNHSLTDKTQLLNLLEESPAMYACIGNL